MLFVWTAGIPNVSKIQSDKFRLTENTIMDGTDFIFKSKIAIQIRMTDLDPFGHVNNGVIYSYYDIGRLHYLQQINADSPWEEMDKIVVHTECDFIEAILWENKICVETKITAIGTKSITMLQRISNEHTGKIKSTCISVLSGYDRNTNTSKAITRDVKEKIETFENCVF